MSEAVSQGKVEIKELATISASAIERFLNEGEGLLNEGKLVQACEKIYKAAEDAVKILVKKHAPDIYRDAESRGRWTISLLDKGVQSLERELGEDMGRGWDAAWVLHVEGFHEERMNEKSVKWRLKYVKRLVELINHLSF